MTTTCRQARLDEKKDPEASRGSDAFLPRHAPIFPGRGGFKHFQAKVEGHSVVNACELRRKAIRN
jgi:hypothetical protein